MLGYCLLSKGPVGFLSPCVTQFAFEWGLLIELNLELLRVPYYLDTLQLPGIVYFPVMLPTERLLP